jgi:hypothetical protein
MFIDDNSSTSNIFLQWLHCPPSVDLVVARLQHDAQVLERLLYTSGGLLKLRKCLYYINFWDFDAEGRASLRASEHLPALLLTNGKDSDAQPINQYD